MGNKALCNGFCDHNTHDQIRQQTTQAPQQVTLRCAICNSEIEHLKFKFHLDLSHYASISQQKNSDLIVNCILCGNQSQSLQQHHKHLNRHQQSAIKTARKRQLPPLNIQLKKTIKETFNDFQIVEETGNQIYTVRIDDQDQLYQMIEFVKEVKALDYDQNLTQGDLIWKNIFEKHRNTAFYQIKNQAFTNTIRSTARLFIPLIE